MKKFILIGKMIWKRREIDGEGPNPEQSIHENFEAEDKETALKKAREIIANLYTKNNPCTINGDLLEVISHLQTTLVPVK